MTAPHRVLGDVRAALYARALYLMGEPVPGRGEGAGTLAGLARGDAAVRVEWAVQFQAPGSSAWHLWPSGEGEGLGEEEARMLAAKWAGETPTFQYRTVSRLVVDVTSSWEPTPAGSAS